MRSRFRLLVILPAVCTPIAVAAHEGPQRDHSNSAEGKGILRLTRYEDDPEEGDCTWYEYQEKSKDEIIDELKEIQSNYHREKTISFYLGVFAILSSWFNYRVGYRAGIRFVRKF